MTHYDDAMKSGTPSPIEAVFFDIDGTLTSFATHTIPQSTIHALNRLKELGIKIFICSGRGPSYMDVILDMMPVEFDGFVGTNGQYCFDNHGFLERQYMDREDVGIIVDWLAKHPEIPANFVEEDRAYFNFINDILRNAWKSLGGTAPKVLVDGDRAQHATDHGMLQISAYVNGEQQQEIISLCHNVSGVRWHPSFVDLIPADGGKPAGMQRFMKHYGFDQSQVMAFGDGGNDITMLQFAGIGVAMGNATDDVKSAADWVTDSVDDDGVMNALVHFGIISQ